MFHQMYPFIPMIPGPVSVHPRILTAMNQDFASEQSEQDFFPFYDKVCRKHARIVNTENEVVLLTGEGMLGLWAGLKSCLLPGDKVLAIGTGVFGDGIGQMAASIGCEVKALSFPYNSTTNMHLQKIEDEIRQFAPKMITMVDCETPSGTLNSIKSIGEIKVRLGVPLLYVDSVSSWGGVKIEMDEWNVDILLGGSQKCLSAPSSMTLIGVSPTAWDVMEKVKYQGYDSILPWRSLHESEISPYTIHCQGVAALNAAADMILDEGLDICFARHKQVAEICREGFQKLGIEVFPDPEATPSPTVTAALVPTGYSFKSWQLELKEHGLLVAGSFGPMHDKVFRLGHMGTQASPVLMYKALNVIRKMLGL